MVMIHSRVFLGALVLFAAGCVGDDTMPTAEEDLCRPGDSPAVFLGQGVGSEFVELDDGQDVGIDMAPQGGFGVNVVVRTERLRAGTGELATAVLETEVGGSSAGSFMLEAPLGCRDDGTGGAIFGLIVGFDPDVYPTQDALLALDGQLIGLVVTVTDSEGNSAIARQEVILRVGG